MIGCAFDLLLLLFGLMLKFLSEFDHFLIVKVVHVWLCLTFIFYIKLLSWFKVFFHFLDHSSKQRFDYLLNLKLFCTISGELLINVDFWHEILPKITQLVLSCFLNNKVKDINAFNGNILKSRFHIDANHHDNGDNQMFEHIFNVMIFFP